MAASRRVLCVAEKPSIAKALAKALSGGSFQSSKTRNKYIWNYDLGYNSPVWGPCEFTITSVAGHLSDIEFLPPFDDFNSEAVQLFSAPIKTVIPPQSKDIALNIEQLSRRSSLLYIWTDCDREGEHIGGEIVDVAKRVNPRIQVWRAAFNNVEPSHLREAAGSPREINKHQIDAVNVRRELDLRSGFALTRLQTKLYRQAFGGDFLKRAVQYGSCQFPTLGFIVDRYMRIKNHVEEPFWYIDATAKGGQNEKPLPLQWSRGKIFDRITALCFYERALKDGDGKLHIEDVVSRPTTRFRPLPLTTVTLQKKASVSLKMSAKKIMDIAERLYNEGYVSYPRTETDSFDKAMDLRKLVRNHCDSDAPWSSYARELMAPTSPKFRSPRVGKRDDKAHPPIHPVQGATRSAFNDNDKWRVYEFITRSFLACCSDDARGFTKTITLKYGEELFKVSGDQIHERNFLDVYPYQVWSGRDLPNWENESAVECGSFLLKDGKTTPPKLLSESELVGLMDANGIGTDATMADHIANIQDRKFVCKRGGFFEPTPLGIALVMSYDAIGLQLSLTKPSLRRETEMEVTAVAQGRSTKPDVLGRLVAKYENVFRQTHSKQTELMLEAKRHMRTGVISTA